METTRTRSPYFSPKSAMAPSFLAASMAMMSAVTGRSSRSTALIRPSISAIAAAGTACNDLKSKRSRPGEFSEPA